ncbi:MAG: hypothetical protein Kow00117_15070 [Phototrophicales bacterium]
MNFKGVIRNVIYDPQVRKRPLHEYKLSEFNINSATAYGIIRFDSSSTLGYSQWVSPKRTRSYPFARIYNTYHLPKRVTIIPIIKDEGINGDLDRINAITFSWMNLANVYIILAYYDSAVAKTSRPGKITKQRLNADYIRHKLDEIRQYQQTALHWNTQHFERDFTDIFMRAVDHYQHISQQTGIAVHDRQTHEATLARYMVDGAFDLEAFKAASLPRSYLAAQRELQTKHELERLSDGEKAYFTLENMLGGVYHLTADSVFWQDGRLIIQEAKNSSRGKLPSLADIQDGLFKLLLFANIDTLYLDGVQIPFHVQLKLTGNLDGQLTLPTTQEIRTQYAKHNQLSSGAQQMLDLLNLEAQKNSRLEIVIDG